MKKWFMGLTAALCLALCLAVNANAAGAAELVTTSNLNITISGAEYNIARNRMYIDGTVNGPSKVRSIMIAALKEGEWTENEITQMSNQQIASWKATYPYTPSDIPSFQFEKSFPVGDKDFGKTKNVLLLAVDENIDLVGYCVVRVQIPKKLTIVDGGVEGISVTWMLDSEGTLTINGTGVIPYDGYPDWIGHQSEIVTVVIDGGITSIEQYAFSECTNLTDVTMRYGVASIGDYAFAGCSSLFSITIPESVTNIGKQAFSDCSSLTCITIPDSVTSIGFWAFENCTSLSRAIVGDGADCIPLGMFSNCTSLSDVTIGESVTSIDNSAFSDCYSLESITIPNGVTVIGGWAFSDCSSLTAVTIPYHVTNIEEFAFDGCSSLLSVVIPNSVTNIWMGAFQSCNQLTDVYYVGTEANWGEIKIEWFNSFLQNATKHYIAPDAVSLGALKYARVSGGFTVQSTLYTPVPATAYFVLYNNLGRFLGVEARTLDAGSAETMTFFVPSGARFAKLMLLDAASAPLCANAEAFLSSGSAGGGGSSGGGGGGDPAE